MDTTIHPDRIELKDRGLVATASAPVAFAHLGFRSLRSWANNAERRAAVRRLLPPEVYTACGRQSATNRLGDTLTSMLSAHPGITGIELWDTMRTGSDYWRPGKLMSAATAELDVDVSFHKHDELCPDRDLLRAYWDSDMSFATYADRYEQALLADDGRRLRIGVEAVIRAQARGRLAVFCCTDPYFSGFAPASERFSTIPMGERSWGTDPVLRDPACHRVVLAELVARWFLDRGLGVAMLEPDVTMAGTKVRRAEPA